VGDGGLVNEGGYLADQEGGDEQERAHLGRADRGSSSLAWPAHAPATEAQSGPRRNDLQGSPALPVPRWRSAAITWRG
jgi:hypothetical protein